MGRKMEYLAMKTDQATVELIDSDINELKIAAKRLISHATKLGGLRFGTSFLKWVASFAAIFFAHNLRDSWVGVFICLIIGCYLLQEHIRASGGFRNSFTQTHGISNTMGIILLLVYPIWALVIHFV